jgi:hypothetical protein
MYLSSLYDDMGDNNGNANGSSSVVPYVLLILLVETMMQFLALVSCLEVFLSYSLLDVVTSCTIIFLVVDYIFSILVKSCEKVLIYPAYTIWLLLYWSCSNFLLRPKALPCALYPLRKLHVHCKIVRRHRCSVPHMKMIFRVPWGGLKSLVLYYW